MIIRQGTRKFLLSASKTRFHGCSILLPQRQPMSFLSVGGKNQQSQRSTAQKIFNDYLPRQGATLGAYSTTATGTRQSPIDIRTQDCVSVTDRQPIYFDYPESIFNVPLKNNGCGWIVNIPTELSKQTAIEQGPLDGKYLLEQFHAHWGGDCSCGSEHTIDGKSYAAELHLVHWNSSRFASFAEAASQDKGLAVVGVFLDVSPEPHPEFEKISSRMKGIQFKDDVVNISEPISLHSLLPSDKCYWSYEGSLTTPPFSESVTWIVLKEPIQVSEKQLEALRSICQHTKDDTPSEGDGRIVKNFRPPQAICNRTITLIEMPLKRYVA